MDFFNLPKSTKFGKVIPKNSFDAFTDTKQKKAFSDCIKRITWTNKLSKETINLIGKDIEEIQVFRIELKQKVEISKLLEVIDKAISYNFCC